MPAAGAWAVSAKADDFFELSGGLPQVSPPRIEEKSPPILLGKQRAPSGGISKGGSPLGSLLHPFLERKGCARPGMRGCHLLGGRQVAAPKSRHLPPEDIALAGSARYQIALWHNG